MLSKAENPYTHKINIKKAESNKLGQKIEQNLKDLKNNVKKIVIGEDSKVDEAILISFFSSIFSNFNNAAELFKKALVDKKIQSLEEKEKNREKLFELKQKVDQYNHLQIEKNIETKKMQDPNISTEDKQFSAKRLQKIAKEMQDLSEFFGYSDENKLIEEMEAAEKLWYGEEVATVLKDFRNLDDSTLAKFEDIGLVNDTFKESFSESPISTILDKIRSEVSTLAREELEGFIDKSINKVDLNTDLNLK